MKPCKICLKQFKPKARTSVTCGSDYCKKKNSGINSSSNTNVLLDSTSSQVRFKNTFLLGGIYAA